MKITRYLVTSLSLAALSLAAAVPVSAQAPGSVDSTYDPNVTSFDVQAVVVQPDGKAIIGGQFVNVGGTAHAFLARLNSDGSLDGAFTYSPSNAVFAVALQPDGKILYADQFSVHRLNSDGNPDGGFANAGVQAPNGFSDIHSVVVQPDGKILIAGKFDVVNGVAHKTLARLNSDGSLDAGFTANATYSTPGNPIVYSMALQADGKILLGGDFDTVNGTSRANVARLNSDGTLDNGFSSNGGAVYSIAVQADGKIVLGLLAFNGGNVVSRLNRDGSVDSGFTTHPGGGNISSVALQADGKIVLGGTFFFSGDSVSTNFKRLNSNGSIDPIFNAVPTGNVDCVALQADGKILLGGKFDAVAGTSRNNLARLNNDNAAQSLSAPDATKVQWMRGGSAPDVSQVTFDYSGDSGASWARLGVGTRIIGGWQLDGLSLPTNGSLRARGTTTTGLGNGSAGLIQQLEDFGPTGSLGGIYNPQLVGTVVRATAVQPDGKAIIAGRFTSLGGTPRNNLARLNQDGSVDSGFNPDVDNEVFSVAVQRDGKILIGGHFTGVGGTLRNNLARLNSDGSLDLAFDPNANGQVTGLAVQPDGKIVLGGSFTMVSNIGRTYVARLNGNGSLDGTVNLVLDADVISVALQADGKILLGGDFTSIGVTGRNHIARLNSDGSLDNAFNPDASNAVFSLAAQADGKILLGGLFLTVGGTPRINIARVNSDGTLDTGFDPNGGVGPVGGNQLYSFALQADGKILLGGEFTTIGTTHRDHLARLNSDGSIDVGFDPDVSNEVDSIAVQGDGKILVGGQFFIVGSSARNHLARLNNDAAPQSLSAPSATTVQWLRGGAAPEVSQVTFETSSNGSAPWTLLGSATRIAGGWQLSGLSLPAGGWVRARGCTTGGYADGTSGLIEQVQSLAPVIVVEQPTGSGLASGATVHFGSTAGTANLTFTVRNAGNSFNLTGLGITITGQHAARFTVTASPVSPVPVGGTTTFTVHFAPDTAGVKTAVLHLASNDTDETPFDINLTATVTAPTITAATGLSRQQGSATTNSIIATVNDAESGPNGVAVIVTSANPVGGITLSNIVNTGGTVTADIVADCSSASGATFILQASDGTLTTPAALNVPVASNTGPVLTYNDPAPVTVNGSSTVNPVTGPSDNGTVQSLVIQSMGTYTGTVTINSAGVVALSNATPIGAHEITIRATDNCGVVKDGHFVVTVSPVPSPTPTATAVPTLTPTPTPTPTPVPASQPLNISTRMEVLGNDNVLIAGIIVTGPVGSVKKVAIRSLGPSLANFGIANSLSDPLLELHEQDGTIITNDNWQDASNSADIPVSLRPSDPRESVILASLPIGSSGVTSFTAVVRGAHGETGIGLAEAYDLDQDHSSRFANVSTRGFIDTGNNVMIGGFILGGSNQGSTIIIRAVGPSLKNFGITNALANPQLELHDGNGNTIKTNDDWKIDDSTGQSQEAAVAATTLQLSNDLESAILATLPPGAYTAVVAGKNNTTGIGLVELYNLR